MYKCLVFKYISEFFSFPTFKLHRTKVKSTMKTPTNSMKTIQLEDLFGSASFGNKVGSSKYTYPNTVPQAKVSTLKSFADLDGDTNADFKVAAYSSASLSNSKRRYQETNATYV